MIYLRKTRDLLKKRWQTEYLHALRDQRNKVRPQELPTPGAVVLVTDSLAGKGFKPQWSIARVISQIKGRDGVVRGLRLKSSKGYEIERPLELIRPLEIQCAESTTLDDVATASADGSTSTGDKPSTTKDDFIQQDEEMFTTTPAEEGDKRGKRRAASTARTANQLIQQYEAQML